MATTSLASYCPICIFGALSSSILSLSSHVVQTITVDVIPHVTVFANGSAPITTYQSITVTQDVVYPTGPAASRPQTYTNEADITWTVGNATLTYPTTYVQYLRFAGAYATSANGEDCVQQTTATIIQLPSSIDEASLIYPVGNQTAGMPLPSLLLEYLGGLETVSAQFSGEALTGCAPLTATPAISSKVITSSTPAVSSSFTIVKSTKRFEGPRSTGSQRPLVTVTQQNGNGTLHRGQSASGTGSSPSNGMSAMTSEVQESFASTSTSKATTPMGSSMATASHTTAFVISAITGNPIVTTIGGPNVPAVPISAGPQTTQPTAGSVENPLPIPSPASHDTAPGSPGSPSPADPTKGPEQMDSPSPQSPDKGQPTTANNPTPAEDNVSTAPNVGFLVGQIGSVATHGASATPTQATPQVSDLLVNIGSVATRQTHATSYVVPGALGGSTYNAQPGSAHITAAAPAGTAVQITAGSNTFSAIQQSGSVVLADATSSITLSPGSSNTFQSQIVAAGSGGTKLVVGSSTYGLGNSATSPTEAVITTDGKTLTAIQAMGSIILQDASSTVTVPVGSAVTFEGQTISAGSSGAVVVNGNAITPSASSTPTEAVITVSNGALAAFQSGDSILLQDISSTATVKDGGTVVFEGHTISAMPSGTAVVVDGTSTIQLAAAPVSSNGLGGYINSGLSPAPSTTSTTGEAAGGNAVANVASGGGLLPWFLVSCAGGLSGVLVLL